MRWSIFPWDLGSWAKALKLSGLAGTALLALQVAEFGQIGSSMARQSFVEIVLIRAPFTLLALVLLMARFRYARLGIGSYSFWFLLFATYFSLSLFWSIEPMSTAGKGLELLIGIAIVLNVSAKKNALECLDALQRLLLLCISSVGLIAITGYLLRLDGFVADVPGLFTTTTAEAPFLSGNAVGYTSSALLLAVFAEWNAGQISNRRALSQLMFSLVIFVFAGSRTSLAILAIGCGVVLFRRAKRLFGLYFVSLTVLVYCGWNIVVQLITKNQVSSNLESLSGRTIMWNAALQYWRQRPLLGFGGGAGGKYVISQLRETSLSGLNSLHSGFLESLTGLGIVGFILGTSLLVAVTLGTFRAWKRDGAKAGIYVLVVHFWLTSIMSTGVLSWMGYEMMLYVVLIATLDVSRRKRVAQFLQFRRTCDGVHNNSVLNEYPHVVVQAP